MDYEIKALKDSPEITDMISQDLDINIPNSVFSTVTLRFRSIPYSADLNKNVPSHLNFNKIIIFQ